LAAGFCGVRRAMMPSRVNFRAAMHATGGLVRCAAGSPAIPWHQDFERIGQRVKDLGDRFGGRGPKSNDYDDKSDEAAWRDYWSQ
jgi:hypothetical protein